MPTRQELLAAEIEAAEKKVYGKGDATPQAPAPKPQVKVEVKPEDNSTSPEPEGDVIGDPKVEAQPKPEDVTDVKPQVEVEDWEARFKSYKGVADATIHGLRQEKLMLQEDIQSLKTQMQELAGKIKEVQGDNKLDISGMFSDEERNLIGEETIKGIEKAVGAAIDANVKPLRTELDKERSERDDAEARRVKADRESANATFLDKLGTLVPDYRKIDVDPQFIQWMKGPDTASGAPRQRLFKNAQSAGDVHRVAEFFLEYTKSTAPKPNEKMEEKITPSNQSVAPKAPDQKPKDGILTMKDINKFYNDVFKGDYRNRPKDQQVMEKKVDDSLRAMGMDRKR
jgi:hypothetical protein